MSKRVLRKLEHQHRSVPGSSALPVDAAWSIYARQSTTRQVEQHTESAELQTKGLWERACALGFNPDLGTIYQEGDGVRGVSGRLRIDQRADLSEVAHRIEAGEVKAVFIVSESRLFRDRTGIQYNVFAQLCEQHDCLIITPHYIYDFARRPFDLKLWRQRCESEADYLDYQLYMMHSARRQAALRGQHVAGNIPVGYQVDYPSKRLVPYEPHAVVVRWLFTRFRELEGKINVLLREIRAKGALFPDAPVRLHLKKVSGGWTISRSGLLYLLTNPIYIGHHVVDQAVAIRNNHEPIVPEADFFYAFDRLSEYDLDGNPRERLARAPARYCQLTTIPCEALLSDRLQAEAGSVLVNRHQRSYVVRVEQLGVHLSGFSIAIAALDHVFEQQFTSTVNMDKLLGSGQAYAALVAASRQQQDVTVEQQLAMVESRMSLLRMKMDSTEDMVLFAKWNTELGELHRVKVQLEGIILDRAAVAQTATEFESILDRIRIGWKQMSYEQKKTAVNVLIERAVVRKHTAHWYSLELQWRVPHGLVQVGYIWHRAGGGTRWSAAEDRLLRELYPAAARIEVRKGLHGRSWEGIVDRAKQLKVRRLVPIAPDGIDEDVTWDDLEYAREHGLSVLVPQAMVPQAREHGMSVLIPQAREHGMSVMAPQAQWTTKTEGSCRSMML